MTRTNKTPRKRDGQPSTAEPPHKKTKLSSESDSAQSKSQPREMGAAVSSVSSLIEGQDEKSTANSTIPQTNPTPVESKKSRKRAADFLSDDEDDAPEVSSSKTEQSGQPMGDKEASKKAKRKKRRDSKRARVEAEKESAASPLTADGVNKLVEKKSKSFNQIKTTKKPAAESMLAEAQRTVDQEIQDEWVGFSDTDKEGSKLNKSNTDPDADDDVEPGLLAAVGEDVDETDNEDLNWDDDEGRSKIPLDKNGRKALKAAKKNAKPDDGPGVIYVGRLPHGFEERGLGGYFGQFGETLRVRVSRNKRTGASKHFAFIEFANADVAAIAAKTMDGYLMYGHILKCKVVPEEQLERMGDSLWKGANKKFRKIPHDKIEREKLAAPKSVDEWRKKTEREQEKRAKRAKKAKEVMGYEMKEVKMKDPQEALDRVKLLKDEAEKEAPVAAIEDAKKSDTVPTNDNDASPPNDDETDEENDDSASKQLLSRVKTPLQAPPVTNGTTKEDDDANSSSESESDGEDVVADLKALRDAVPISPEKLNTAGQLVKKPVVEGTNQSKPKDTTATIPTAEPAIVADNELPTSKKKMSKAERKALKQAKTEHATDADGKPVKREKYMPPTHKKLLAKAKFAKDHPEEHKAKKLEQRREEKQKRWEKKEKRSERQYENRQEKRAQKAKEAASKADEGNGRVAIGSEGVAVKSNGKKITFD